MTFGAGGHTSQLLEQHPEVKVFALDRDPVAYGLAKTMSLKVPKPINTFAGEIFRFTPPFKRTPDMRMDRGLSKDTEQITAADVLARAEEADLVKILRIYGEEKAAKKIARAIVEARNALHKIETTKQLADLVVSCLTDTPFRMDKMQRPTHVATKTFQALRIFVNNELNEITMACLANPVPLKYCGHDITHDKDIVESLISTNWKQLHKHVILPSDEEVMRNSRSRSAKLRAAIKQK
ncbi:Probable methyltransferase-like protein 15 homolog [Eumeta japonica]|uniref:Probable methyltransferase-like protein 15 homolog n=1 Tax=Eumeta variegata TaxID=151549 RepID=A0A4C1TJ76_EUMVA|nr:Probable methyltransferase-like protein 15 homolog [Eumeta japonica]